MFTNPMRQLANLVFAIGQLVLPPLLFSAGFTATSARPPLDAPPNPATPADYAFTIWTVIYLGALVYAIAQARPTAATDPLFRRIGWLTAAGYALCLAWLCAARFGPVWLTVPLIFGMLATLGSAFLVAVRNDPLPSSGRRLTVVAPLAVYAGWLSAAAFVNAADVLPGYGFTRFGLSAEQFGWLVLLFATAVALLIAQRSHWYWPYVATVAWALVAIAARNEFAVLSHPTAASSMIAAVTLVGLAIAAAARVRVNG